MLFRGTESPSAEDPLWRGGKVSGSLSLKSRVLSEGMTTSRLPVKVAPAVPAAAPASAPIAAPLPPPVNPPINAPPAPPPPIMAALRLPRPLDCCATTLVMSLYDLPFSVSDVSCRLRPPSPLILPADSALRITPLTGAPTGMTVSSPESTGLAMDASNSWFTCELFVLIGLVVRMLRTVPADTTIGGGGVGVGVGAGVGVSTGEGTGELSGSLGGGVSALGFLGLGACSAGEEACGAEVSLDGVGLASCWLAALCFSLALLLRQPDPKLSSRMAVRILTRTFVRMGILQLRRDEAVGKS